MAVGNSHYDDKSIRSLKGPDQVRKKAGVIFGTNDEKGAAHSIYEIIANSIDEAREGYGKRILVEFKDNGEVIVSDDGRGIPMGWNEGEQKYNWELVFCTLYASGKYDSSNYAGSLGTNGLGATATQYASEYMEVYSTRDGVTYHIRFEKGEPVIKLETLKPIREGTGTTIIFKPDSEVFVGIKQVVMPAEYYIDLLRRQAMLHDGLEIILRHPDLPQEMRLCYPKGICEFIDVVCQKPMLKKTMYFEDTVEISNNVPNDEEPFQFRERFALNFSREQPLFEMYHNGSHLFEGGTTVEAMHKGLLAAFDYIAHANNKLSSNSHFLYRDIESILVCIGDTNAPGHSSYFKNQTKAAVTNQSFVDPFSKFVFRSILNWEKQDKVAVAKIVDEIVVNKQAREEAEKVSKKVVNQLSRAVTNSGNAPKKFVNCQSKYIPEKELWIVEGDSAAGSCKLARDSKFQAIMPVRGKILNCLKADLSKILNNEIIVDLLRIFGCGIEAKSKYIDNLPPFNLMNLNWGKIIICTDADLDGMQIRCLVLTMIYRLCPTLLKAGKVFIAETPLFEMSYGKTTEFAYTVEEKEELFAKFEQAGISRNKVKVSRSKGLGENDPDMMNRSTMNPLSRRLVPVEYPNDDSRVPVVFETLLGNDLEMRRQVIEDYFKITETDID